MLNDIIDDVYKEGEYRPKFVYTADNHEYWASWPERTEAQGIKTFEECQQIFMNGLGLESVHNYTEIGGYAFISISSDKEKGDASYSDTTIGKLGEWLETAATKYPNKPIFVAVHQPEHTDEEGSVKLYDKLREYSQVVLFTSHTHYLLRDERSIQQNKITTVNTAKTSLCGLSEIRYRW